VELEGLEAESIKEFLVESYDVVKQGVGMAYKDSKDAIKDGVNKVQKAIRNGFESLQGTGFTVNVIVDKNSNGEEFKMNTNAPTMVVPDEAEEILKSLPGPASKAKKVKLGPSEKRGSSTTGKLNEVVNDKENTATGDTLVNTMSNGLGGTAPITFITNATGDTTETRPFEDLKNNK
jgi:ribosomal protein L7Ae-like RNA K-turn-binding protein